jgi:hypothetical protein
VQEKIRKATGDLVEVRVRVQAIAEEIPEPSEEVLEHLAPRTLAADLKGGLEIVAHDLGEAVASLEKLGQIGDWTV